MDLSVIIVNFNTRALTRQSIDSIIKNTSGIDYEIIVVDNSTEEDQKYTNADSKTVKVINVQNHGFGHACNIGAGISLGKYLLFLNSDTLINDNSLYKCIKYIEADSRIGVLGARILLRDGTLDHGCKRGFPTPMAALYYYTGMDRRFPESRKFGAYRQTFLNELEINEVDSVSGAFLMIGKEVYHKIKGFDEAFFMYGEDLDLCYRVKEEGKKVVYYPEAVIIHLKGQSGLHKSSKTVIYHFYNAMILFYNKHYKGKYNIFTTTAIYSAIKIKYYLTLFKSRRK